MAENNGHAVAAAPTPVPVPPFEFYPPPMRPDRPSFDVKPVEFLHAFRRRGIVCIPIAILLAVAATLGTWFVQEPIYEAMAILRLSATGTELVFDQLERTGDYALFQGTQKELANSRFVMSAALVDPKVSQLSLVRSQEDPVGWLHKNIDISTPQDTEIMLVSLRSPDPVAAPILVNAVVDAYQTEVVNRQRNDRQLKLDRVTSLYNAVQNDLRRQRESLKQFAAQIGTSDRATLSVMEQRIVGLLGGLMGDLVEVEVQLIRAEAELGFVEAQNEATEESKNGFSPRTLRYAIENDVEFRTLQRDQAEAMRMKSEAASAFKDGVPKLGEHLKDQADTRMKDRLALLEQELQILGPMDFGFSVQDLKNQVLTLKAQEAFFKDKIVKLEEELGVSSEQSYEVEIRRAELEQLERTRDRIAQQKSELEVELKSQPRVQLYHEADESVLSNQISRAGLSALAGFAAFMIPVALILFMDVQSKKVNSSEDVARFADLNIVGTVPLIPAQAVRHLAKAKGDGRGRYHYWQTILAESVNRIASSLLMESSEDPKMILVTSAIGGEGKTTLSTQLAMSLARAGRRVVLVDIDLRRPMIHRTFGLPDTPGICEALRGEIDLTEAVQPTGIENLSAVVAGQCDRLAIRLLGHESTASLLKELRGLGDFVIVDGCPVLPLADTGYICPYVDSVLFAVRRDVSRMAQVRSAHNFVAKCGIDVLGAVVTEGSGSHYRDERYYLRD
jgi:succinoglycan biosynthesis transport protein ExoP